MFDASSGGYRALRIDAAAADATLRVRGPVQQIDTNNRTVRIAGASCSLQALAQPPSGLGLGQIVRLQCRQDQRGQRQRRL